MYICNINYKNKRNMNNIISKIGEIVLGPKVMVSDPCYEIGVWCQGIIENVKSGRYNCYVDDGDAGTWGGRTYRLLAVHSDYDVYNNVYCDDHLKFDVGVDSGTCGIFDFEYYKSNHNELGENNIDQDTWYDINVFEECENGYNICDEKGVWSQSGYGDGSYNCYVQRDKDGNVVAIEIIFIEEDEDDE